MITSLNLDVENRPNSGWSFHGGRGNSNVDVTLTRELSGKVLDWAILDSVTSSDHSLITFILADEVTMIPASYKKRFQDNKTDATKLQNAIKIKLGERPLNGTPDDVALQIAYRKLTCRSCPNKAKGRPQNLCGGMIL